METLALEKQEQEEEEEEEEEMVGIDLNPLESRRWSKRGIVSSEDDDSGGVNGFKGRNNAGFVAEEESKVEDEVEANDEDNESFPVTTNNPVGIDLNPLESRRWSKCGIVSSEDDDSGGVNGSKGRNNAGFVAEEESKVEDEVEANEEDNESFPVTTNNPEAESDILVAAEKGTQHAGTTNEFSEIEDVTAVFNHPKPNIGDDVIFLKGESSVSISSTSDTAINQSPAEILIENSSTSLSFPPPEIRRLEKGTEDEDHNSRERQHAETRMLKGAEEVAIAELDVDRVLQKQETHDLFCPNCNSCITRRVILRRRKRKIQEISVVGEVVKPDDHATLTLVEDRDIVRQDSSENEPTAVLVQEVDTERDVFRCLSCFSIFVPTSNGFKFWPFGDKTVEENLQFPVRVSPSTEATSSPATTVDSVKQGTGFKFWVFGGKEPDKDAEEHIESSQEVSTTEAAMVEPAMSVVDKSITQGKIAMKENVGESVGLPNLDELQLNLDTPASAALPSEDPPIKITFSLPAEPSKPEKEASFTLSTPNTPLIVMPIDEHQGEGQKLPNYSNESSTSPNNPEIADVIIQIDENRVQPESSETRPPTNDAVVEESAPLLLADTTTIEAGADGTRPTGLDVVRAMVYGGLVESIASLSVVTSAVGADSGTLNVLVLGVANVVGGLFVLAHNLRVLRHETVTRYEELLGRTGHFVFHASAAVLSYLIFGLLPPIIYGFSFRKSNNRDLKLVTLASTSLLCIFLLSFGKAHIKSPPKQYIKTITYYVMLGIMVSGGSFIVGDLLKLLMDKLGWFDSTDSLTMHIPQGRPWASS
ncbi:Membrane protein of ER body-like protein [Drosera capensis]